MDAKTSAFCNRFKKVINDKIEMGNTYHKKLPKQLLRKSDSEEPMFWEVQISLPPMSPFLQYKVEVHNPFRSAVEDIQNCVCVYSYSFTLKW